MKINRFNGYGPGYCYFTGNRACIVLAENLETVRLMVSPSARIRAVRPYSTARQLFILQLQ